MTSREMAIEWLEKHTRGKPPVFSAAEIPGDVEGFARLAERLAVEKGLARSGDKICLVLGPPLGYQRSGQGMIVHTLP